MKWLAFTSAVTTFWTTCGRLAMTSGRVMAPLKTYSPPRIACVSLSDERLPMENAVPRAIMRLKNGSPAIPATILPPSSAGGDGLMPTALTFTPPGSPQRHLPRQVREQAGLRVGERHGLAGRPGHAGDQQRRHEQERDNGFHRIPLLICRRGACAGLRRPTVGQMLLQRTSYLPSGRLR